MTTQDWSLSGGLPPELEAEQRRLQKQQRITDALLARSQTPYQPQMAGGYVVPYSPLQGAGQMLAAYVANRKQGEIDKGITDLGNRYRQGMTDELSRYQQAKIGTPASSESIVDEQANGGEGAQATINAPAVAGDPRRAVMDAMVSQYPQVRQLAKMDYESLQKQSPQSMVGKLEPKDYTPESWGRFLQTGNTAELKTAKPITAPAKRDVIQGDTVIQQEQKPDGTWVEIGRGPRFARQVPSVVVAGGPSRAPKPPVGYRFAEDGETLEPIPGGPKDPKAKPPEKLPPAALKLQQEEVDAINTAAGIQSDVTALRQQIESGKLKLGLAQNLAGRARNFVGASDENSRNLASFMASVEKLRNDSLRLNKGVQTEGDAQRALNELMSNINDPKVVSQRLDEIRKINERAVLLRKNNIDMIRRNYGMGALDTSVAENQKPVVGGGDTGGFRIVGAE